MPNYVLFHISISVWFQLAENEGEHPRIELVTSECEISYTRGSLVSTGARAHAQGGGYPSPLATLIRLKAQKYILGMHYVRWPR